jgi:hypothetical protein
VKFGVEIDHKHINKFYGKFYNFNIDKIHNEVLTFSHKENTSTITTITNAIIIIIIITTTTTTTTTIFATASDGIQNTQFVRMHT